MSLLSTNAALLVTWDFLGIVLINFWFRELEDCENIAFLMANADNIKSRSVKFEWIEFGLEF